MDLADETVFTSRRALLHSEAQTWTAGRLRVSDRAVRFTSHDGAVTEVSIADLASVRVARRPNRALVLETDAGPLRLRCLALPAVAALLFVVQGGLEARSAGPEALEGRAGASGPAI